MKSILISGGAQGIGFETARLFHSRGWKVGVLDIDSSRFQDVHALSPDIKCYIADVTNTVSIKVALDAFLLETGGKLDVLLNNAGVVEVGEFDQMPIEMHHKIIDVNLKGTVNLTHAAIPSLTSAGQSVIINMSSASALYGNPEITTYAATKSAVRSLTEAWNLSFRKYGIRVADVLPIYVKTRMVNDYHHKYKNVKLKDVKLTPEKVAKVIWQAAHGKKIHYLVGVDTKVYGKLVSILPQSWIPPIVRAVLKYKD